MKYKYVLAAAMFLLTVAISLATVVHTANIQKPQTNPFLDKFQRKLEAEYLGRLERLKEFSLASSLIAANDTLQVGPGRAKKFLDAQLAMLSEIAEMVVEDEDEMLHTKSQMARRLKEILGEESWSECCVLFPFLKEFW